MENMDIASVLQVELYELGFYNSNSYKDSNSLESLKNHLISLPIFFGKDINSSSIMAIIEELLKEN
tara:strand:+ start:146 stop:343 length:198 start_codon:yes stop_codon:yes gene_type:complete